MSKLAKLYESNQIVIINSNSNSISRILTICIIVVWEKLYAYINRNKL